MIFDRIAIHHCKPKKVDMISTFWVGRNVGFDTCVCILFVVAFGAYTCLIATSITKTYMNAWYKPPLIGATTLDQPHDKRTDYSSPLTHPSIPPSNQSHSVSCVHTTHTSRLSQDCIAISTSLYLWFNRARRL